MRPNHKKYTTAIKTNSLNPTFNETFEFPVKAKDIEGKARDNQQKGKDQYK